MVVLAISVLGIPGLFYELRSTQGAGVAACVGDWGFVNSSGSPMSAVTLTGPPGTPVSTSIFVENLGRCPVVFPGVVFCVSVSTCVPTTSSPPAGLSCDPISSVPLDTQSPGVVTPLSTTLSCTGVPGTYAVKVTGKAFGGFTGGCGPGCINTCSSDGCPETYTTPTITFSISKDSVRLTTSITPSSLGAVGGTVSDQATLSGGFPTTGVMGNVNYFFYSNAQCTGPGTPEGTPPVGALNAVGSSNPVILTSAGVFSFNAMYTGDINNRPETSSCETLLVLLIKIAGATSTGVFMGTGGDIVIFGTDATGKTIGQIFLPAGTTFPSGTVTGNFATIGSSTLIEISGIALPTDSSGNIIPKSILVAANPGNNSVCIVDTPTPPATPNCSATNISAETILLPCPGSTGQIGAFAHKNFFRSYTCSLVGGSFLVTGLDYSSVKTLGTSQCSGESHDDNCSSCSGVNAANGGNHESDQDEGCEHGAVDSDRSGDSDFTDSD